MSNSGNVAQFDPQVVLDLDHTPVGEQVIVGLGVAQLDQRLFDFSQGIDCGESLRQVAQGNLLGELGAEFGADRIEGIEHHFSLALGAAVFLEGGFVLRRGRLALDPGQVLLLAAGLAVGSNVGDRGQEPVMVVYLLENTTHMRRGDGGHTE
jgi:hypothetical protein